MDVKGAKALSERLAEAARNVDPPPRESGGVETGRKPDRLEAMTREQREIIRKQIDALMRERLGESRLRAVLVTRATRRRGRRR